MPLQITAFTGYTLDDRKGVDTIPVPDGKPLAVTATSFTGTYTVPANCQLVRIYGTGTITWPGIATAEAFDGVEFRGVRPGNTFTVA